MNAIEKLAREHDALLANYRRLLRVLHDVAAGAIHPSRLHADLQSDAWSVAANLAVPAGPALTLDALRRASAEAEAAEAAEAERAAADDNGTHVE